MRGTSSPADWNKQSKLPALTTCGELKESYLKVIKEVVDKGQADYSRLSVIRFDLRLPSRKEKHDCLSRDLPSEDDYDEYCRKRISRFIDSLKIKVKHDRQRRGRHGKRAHPTEVRYVWARERSRSENEHYHVAILVNKDSYFSVGDYDSGNSLSGLIKAAWASALRCHDKRADGLVYFPENCTYHVCRSSKNYQSEYSAAFKRLSYLAKVETKCYGSGQRSFGYSQK